MIPGNGASCLQRIRPAQWITSAALCCMKGCRVPIRSIVAVVCMLWLRQAGAALPTVEIGAEDDWYPYSGQIATESKGMAEDIVRASFAAAGFNVHFVSLPYARCVHMVLTGELAGCFDTSRTRENERDFLWPDQPMFYSRAYIYAPSSSTEHDLGPRALEGKHVAVTNGYEYGSDFDGDPLVQRAVTNQSIYSLRMLALGRVQYALAFEKVADYLIRTHKSEFDGKFKVVGMTAQTDIYCVFSRSFKDSRVYLAAFNHGFATIQANGTYQDIVAAWR